MKLNEILDEITVRFVINTKEFALIDTDYLFLLEQAYWFAVDFYGLDKIQYKQFCLLVLKHNGLFDNLNDVNVNSNISESMSEVFKSKEPTAAVISKATKIQNNAILNNFHKECEDFKKYKQSVLVFGAILFNGDMSKALVVKQHNTGNMAFPKGKKNENESGEECAIREVYEEIGYDISDKIGSLSVKIFNKITLFIILNVPEFTHFEPIVRNEIDSIFWVDVENVPQNVKFKIVATALNEAKGLMSLFKQNSFKFRNMDAILDGTEEKEERNDGRERNTTICNKIGKYITAPIPRHARTMEELEIHKTI